MLVQALPSGPLDFVGDVHGEWQVLQVLISKLGYDGNGFHPEGRRLVFLGDLVDRGPDSLAVFQFVRDLMEKERGFCILGNHELNLWLGKHREGNEWFWGKTQTNAQSGVVPQTLASDSDRTEILDWLKDLPLVLEGADVRVVHACWDEASVSFLRDFAGNARQAFKAGSTPVIAAIRSAGALAGTDQADLLRQNVNPVTVTTSGQEALADEPFMAGGKLRNVKRVPWWEKYEDEVAVVFGHYWRSLEPENRPVKRGPYLFHGSEPEAPLGPRQNAWCIDYSIGYRCLERDAGDRRVTALAALRFPERKLVFSLRTKV